MTIGFIAMAAGQYGVGRPVRTGSGPRLVVLIGSVAAGGEPGAGQPGHIAARISSSASA